MFQIGDRVNVSGRNGKPGRVVEVSTWLELNGPPSEPTPVYKVECDNWKPPTRWLPADDLTLAESSSN